MVRFLQSSFALSLTRGVHADIVAAAVGVLLAAALILVETAGAGSGLPKSFVADALVRAHHVLTDTVGADTGGQGALVNVLAGLAVGGQLVTCINNLAFIRKELKKKDQE